MATSRVYTLFQNITPEQIARGEQISTEEKGEFAYDDKNASEAVTEDKVKRERPKNAQDISDLFNAWNSMDDEGEPDDLQGAEAGRSMRCRNNRSNRAMPRSPTTNGTAN